MAMKIVIPSNVSTRPATYKPYAPDKNNTGYSYAMPPTVYTRFRHGETRQARIE